MSIGLTSGRPRRAKYAAIRTTIDGVVFDSKREAHRYGHLRYLEKAGDIARLELQPVFPLFVAPFARLDLAEIVGVGKYVADFRYLDQRTGEVIVEDVKGVRTATYKLKKRIVEALYGIAIREV